MLMKTFPAKRAIRSYTQHLQATPDKVFPLRCPIREYEWIEYWDCTLFYSDSGIAEENCIFTTNFLQNGGEEVWVVSHYEQDREIQFVRLSDLKVTRHSIALTDNGDGTTTAVWQQLITGRNDRGNAFIQNYTDADYAKHMKMLETMLNHFLTTGTILKKAAALESESGD
jgi:hypothetical protein